MNFTLLGKILGKISISVYYAFRTDYSWIILFITCKYVLNNFGSAKLLKIWRKRTFYKRHGRILRVLGVSIFEWWDAVLAEATGLGLFCCYQPSCVVSQQSWFGLFFCFNFTPPPRSQDTAPKLVKPMPKPKPLPKPSTFPSVLPNFLGNSQQSSQISWWGVDQWSLSHFTSNIGLPSV